MMGKNHESEKFKLLLDAEYEWPAEFTFKFIAPIDKREEILKVLPKKDFSERVSKRGNYSAVTIRVVITSSNEVIDIYREVGNIEGVIAL